MVSVRFFEGPFDREAIVHDTKMPVVPLVGQTLTLRLADRQELRFEVTGVDYLLDTQKSISPVEELTGVRVNVRSI